ncbi:MAG: hypothetical protein KC729_21590, partial [Candidatus Eisenbacteria bacterium]|nr:hypothetical protein [Candidatus Eisenbacteria bacterium]
HRMVDPIYDSGIDPPEDVDVLAGIADVPGNYANGQYVADPEDRRRGPFEDAAAPHTFLASAFHRSSDFCGTCHDVSNPVFERVGGSDYAPGPLDEPPNDFDSSVLLPLERTYSEWKNSEFATTGVYAPEFAGNKPDGIVSTCQDCHMADAQGRGCNVPGTPLRDDLPRHDLTGGNAWVPSIVEQAYPGEVDAQALADGAQRAISMLERAALLDVAVDPEPNGYLATVTITNRSGHKLPTGYPEGRRMWVSLAAYDAADQIIYESGAYDPGTGILVEDDDLALYEAKMGISPALAGALGLPAGASFHFTLNDSIYSDTRIPPLGFTNAGFESFGGQPVDPEAPGIRYADGQNWDAPQYHLPTETDRVIATLYYQTTSKEYVDFLRDENTTDDRGTVLHDLWSSNGRSSPVVMVADTADVGVTAIPPALPFEEELSVSALQNPFRDRLVLRLRVPTPSEVIYRITDVSGRLVCERAQACSAGPIQIVWDGTDGAGRAVSSGLYWVNIRAGD